MRTLGKLSLVASLVALSAVAVAAGTIRDVTQSGRVFSQTDITIKAGDGLRISNEDPVTHSLFARTAEYDIHETQAPGAESTLQFDKPGVVELRCAIHPQMVLKVTVTE